MNKNKYEKAKVYKIWSSQGDKIYIGSTCKNYLSQRMTAHRGSYKHWKINGTNGHVSSYILFEDYGVENCFIELLEAKSCCSKDELIQLEGKYIRELECVNKVIPNRDIKEYKNQYVKDHKQELLEYQSNYQLNNKQILLAKKKQYYEKNKEKLLSQKNEKYACECGNNYTYSNKSQHFKSIKHCQFIEAQNNLI